ncbi:MAG TPA: hypothetical protein VF939_20230 [Puia sp.]
MLITLASLRIRNKTGGIAMICILIGAFVTHTVSKYQESTGIRQFSAFGGWQIASNALFMYAHARPEPSDRVPASFKWLHSLVNQHMDSLQKVAHRPDTALSDYYLWVHRTPLFRYAYTKWVNDSTTGDFEQWASMGPLYSAYGGYLIKNNPGVFIRYYVWPNMINYYVPDTEFMGIYNMGRDTVEEIAKSWFGYKTNKIHSFASNERIMVVEVFPILLAIINLVFVLGFIGFLLLDGFKKSILYFSKSLKWVAVIWFGNFGFSVLASPIVLRYQVFPMIMAFAFLVLLIRFIIQENRSEKTEQAAYRDNAGMLSKAKVQAS